LTCCIYVVIDLLTAVPQFSEYLLSLTFKPVFKSDQFFKGGLESAFARDSPLMQERAAVKFSSLAYGAVPPIPEKGPFHEWMKGSALFRIGPMAEEYF
jgi:hypothetical protein